MSEPLLISRFHPLLDSGEIDRSGLLPDDARELLAIAEAQDRVIRHLAALLFQERSVERGIRTK